MTGNQYLAFYSYFGKFRRLPVEGLFLQNGEGANEKFALFYLPSEIFLLLQQG